MIVILGCGASKRPVASPAIDLYTGSLFAMARKWALSVTSSRQIMILSAKHGLVPAEATLEPYDLKMSRKAGISVEMLAAQIDAHKLREQRKIVVIAGAEYVRRLREAGLQFTDPLAGLTLGMRMRSLKLNMGKVP